MGMPLNGSDQVRGEIIRLLSTTQSETDGISSYRYYSSSLVPILHAPSRVGLMVSRFCELVSHPHCPSSDAWPSFSAPHSKSPSVSPTGQFLASLTLLHPQLLRHEALVVIPPPTNHQPSPPLISEAALPDCLHAWILSLEKQLCADIS